MMNSPKGDLVVEIYRNTDGREYSIDPQTNQVVEIDVRATLSKFAPQTPILSTEELEKRALKYFEATIPDFKTRKSSWKYEEGRKGDNYFFSWYSETVPGTRNRPLAQIGININGVLFAYHNTLSLDK